MTKKSVRKDPFTKLDLAPYAGRWVAIVRGRIAGVGLNEQAARLASKHQRPIEEPVIVLVPEELAKDERPRTKG